MKNRGYFKLIVLCFFFCPLFLFAQQKEFAISKDTIISLTYYYDDAWLPFLQLKEIFIQPKNLDRKTRKRLLARNRLIIAVRKTYPYAKIASSIFKDIQQKEKELKNKKQLKKYIKEKEKALKKQFASKLMRLTVYQGKILMKLFYRETHTTCHQLLKDYKGGFSAGFWQSIARLFGSTLKQTYYPDKDLEDRMIEQVVRQIEEKS